jgi:hypothetical protein
MHCSACKGPYLWTLSPGTRNSILALNWILLVQLWEIHRDIWKDPIACSFQITCFSGSTHRFLRPFASASLHTGVFFRRVVLGIVRGHNNENAHATNNNHKYVMSPQIWHHKDDLVRTRSVTKKQNQNDWPDASAYSLHQGWLEVVKLSHSLPLDWLLPLSVTNMCGLVHTFDVTVMWHPHGHTHLLEPNRTTTPSSARCFYSNLHEK